MDFKSTAEPVLSKKHKEVVATLREIVRQHRREPVKFTSLDQGLYDIVMESYTGPSMPPKDPRTYVRYGIKADQFRAEMLREKRLEVYRSSQKDSGSLTSGAKVQNTKTKQTAQKAKSTLPLPNKEEGLVLRKVPEEEMEERVSPEPEEDKKVNEEVKEVDTDDLTERIMRECTFFTDVMEEEGKLIKSLECQIEEIQESCNQRDEEVQKMARLIKQEEAKIEHLKSELSREDSVVITRRLRIKECCEKLRDVYTEIFDRPCSAHFPSLILLELDGRTTNLVGNMTDEEHVKLLKQFWKHQAIKERTESEAKAQARRERRIRERREIAFAPPAKIVGKRLMPRMLPPKKVEKKQPEEEKLEGIDSFLN